MMVLTEHVVNSSW